MTDIVALSIAEGANNFACAFEHGFSIYSLNPLKLKFKKEFINFNLTCISTNSEGTQTAFAVKPLIQNSNIQKVYIWNNFFNEADGELEFKDVIRCICIRKTILVIVLTDSVCLYDIQKQSYTGFEQITFQNLAGACDVSFSEEFPKIAICGLTPGAVQIFSEKEESAPIFFSAHLHPVSIIKFSMDCKMIATASEQGTIIRVFDGITGSLQNVFRRGNLRSKILAMCFSPDNQYLLAMSANGTLHMFDLQEKESSEENPSKSINKLQVGRASCVEMVFKDENEIIMVLSSGIVSRVLLEKGKLSLISNQVALSH
ncbi:hypothetical protein TRFO_28306 [Tritrichomonas foetus]|uniref:Uncharacterized protein n=1 Tax=Tritrichomonas foetus TaxID=1144522 RepID=A0A1J4K3F0_9EUKA|nr:hypothetical protein TRFO_28306 [Tritrichomonas foetus]|eukprot:OHT04254.1 hypothetical protein TRFO_28306 [Tritrichomonas foetus]